MNAQYEALFRSLALRSGVILKNRVVMAPMTNFASNEDGSVSDNEVAYYAHRSGGVGMVVTACSYVTANGKGFPGEIAAHRDEMIDGLRKLSAAIQAEGAKAVLQIFHGGRQCPPPFVGGDVVSASAVPDEKEGSVTPRALSDEEIRQIILAFGEATRRAIEAGFDGVELHGANGYLLQQFFSPHSNRRTDEWGGSLEKRMAFPLAVVKEVRRVVAAHARRPFLIGYRLSPEEPTEPGITMNDTLALVDALCEQSLDYLHVSLMEFWSKPRSDVDDSKSRIEWIVDRAGDAVPVIGVGSIRTPDEAARALESGAAMIALGRELIMEPDWVQKTQQGREAEIATTLSKRDQKRLVIPDPLFHAIVHSPGWFPVVE